MKNPKIGQAVWIPTERIGYHQWLYKVGIVRDIKLVDDHTKVIYEAPTKNYGQELRNIRGEVVGFGSRTTERKCIDAAWLDPVKTLQSIQNIVNEHRREELCAHTYNRDTEFLIDMGVISDPHPEDARGPRPAPEA